MKGSHIRPTLCLGFVLVAGLAFTWTGIVLGEERPGQPCSPKDIPKTSTRDKTGDEVLLNIPDRPHAPERPPEGWCGECVVQQALLFHGAYFHQRDINKAGKPKHPDLYASDIPVALKNLGVRIQFGPSRDPLPRFLEWLREQIRAGNPVLVGMKIHPTKHENWMLDHFTLVPGFSKKGFTINTTWDKQVHIPLDRLQSTKKGLSFQNRYKRYYGISIQGAKDGAGTGVTVRLFVRKETLKEVNLVVKCEGLTPGTEYEIIRSASYGGEGALFVRFRARREIHAYFDTIRADGAAVYRCIRRPPSSILGDMEVKYFKPEAGALGSGRPIKPILEKLERESAGLSEKAAEAERILSAVDDWRKRETGRLRSLAETKPSDALKAARRFARRIRGLEEESEVQELIKTLEAGMRGK